MRARCASNALPMPLPRSAGRTNRSSRYRPRRPRKVEKLWKNSAKPAGSLCHSAITTSAYGRSLKRLSSSWASVATTSWASFSYSASSRMSARIRGRSSRVAGRRLIMCLLALPAAVARGPGKNLDDIAGRKRAHARRRAGEDQIATPQGEACSEERHQSRHGKQQPVHFAVLARLAVDAALEGDAREVRRCCHEIAQWRAVVEGLGKFPRQALLLEAILHASQGEIEAGRDADDVLRAIGAITADQQHDLRLVMHGPAIARQADGPRRRHDRRRWFHEHHRLLAHCIAQLRRMRRVIAADAEDARNFDGVVVEAYGRGHGLFLFSQDGRRKTTVGGRKSIRSAFVSRL